MCRGYEGRFDVDGVLQLSGVLYRRIPPKLAKLGSREPLKRLSIPILSGCLFPLVYKLPLEKEEDYNDELYREAEAGGERRGMGHGKNGGILTMRRLSINELMN